MPFIQTDNGKGYLAGYFLSHEECVRKTMQMTATASYVTTTTDGRKYVKAGTIYPANDNTAIGIVYEDVDVTTGNMPGSVVLSGRVYTNRLPVAPTDDETSGGTTTAGSKSTLESKGFIFETEPTVTRP